ncbi:PRK13768 family protein [Thermococcus sp.]
MLIIFLGTAGSGKSTLTGEFGKYLETEGYNVAYVNLDTGVRNLIYVPDIDVRESITVDEIMKEGYGPNGAIVESYDRLMEHLEYYSTSIAELERKNDYVLVDTPGQMETFLFHEFGWRIMEDLDAPLVVYLFDPGILRRLYDFCFVRFFAILMELRLGSAVVPVLNKIDTIDNLEDYRRYLEDMGYLTSRLKFDPSMQGYLAYKLCLTFPEVASPTRVLYISAKRHRGFEDLESVAHEHYCTCGDLT